MKINRLLDILDQWARWMKRDEHRLGYPSKISYLRTGGESSHDAFDIMIEISDNKNVEVIDTIIHDLPKAQKQAIYARYLKDKKPMYYEKHLELAMDNLLTIADRKIYA